MNAQFYQYIKYFILLCSIFITGITNAFQNSVFMSTVDIEAGQKSSVRISGLTYLENVSLILKRPTKESLSFSKQSDESGTIFFSIPSLHTEKSGEYLLELIREFSDKVFLTEKFQVFPAKISSFRSTIDLSSNSIPADGKSASFIEIALKDAFSNPIANAPIKAFSSRNEDFVLLEERTNKEGQAKGKIFSSTPGVGVISILAENLLLFEKPEIVFHINKNLFQNAGASGFGEFLQASLFNSETEDGQTAYFTIEGLNSEQTANEDLTVQVSAKDANGNIDTNYTGTIRFSSTDSKARLPADYKFKPTDQGVHTFYLAISFGTAGQQTLSVLDTNDDFRISGELNVNVLSTEKNTPPLVDTDANVRIDLPTNGAKFNSSRVTIGGSSNNCGVLKIVDGPSVLIEKLAVDSDGSYSYQTPQLADGYHEFQAFCFPNSNTVSNKVGITIDREAPTVMSVELSPATCVQPGEKVEIKVGSSEDLSNANCIINNKPLSFEAIDAKTFSATTIAPNKLGQYPFQCSIFDILGNELQEQNAGVVDVCEAKIEPVENIAPSCVNNLNAKPGKDRVTLFWSPAKDDKGIKNYKILYGNCETPLTEINITPDDRTQWYVDNLASCQKYCFAVSPIDSEGLENDICTVEKIEESPICDEPEEIVPPESGRGSNLPFIISVIVGILSFLFLAKKKNT